MFFSKTTDRMFMAAAAIGCVGGLMYIWEHAPKVFIFTMPSMIHN